MIDYEEFDLGLEERFDDSRVRFCPLCGGIMEEMSERYDLSVPFEDKWFECPYCGYCISRN